jgi:integron integrase
MKPAPSGLIGTFLAVSSVNTPKRRALAKKTQETYAFWLRRFYRYVKVPATEWTGEMVQHWLWHLHSDRYAHRSRQQALCALVYVFKNVLQRDVGTLNLPSAPRQKPTLRIIPSRQELGRIFAGLHGQSRLMAGIMYGSGLRVMECCTLRVKDIDLDTNTIRVHSGKGDKDRLCLLPQNLREALQRQIQWRAAVHQNDLAQGAGIVDLPGRYASKNPAAARDLRWQFLFPSTVLRGQRRWHITPEAIQKALRAAVKASGITKLVTPHTLRHAYCTHSLQAGNDIMTVKDLMGHDTIETTQIYAHADHARGVSPLDVANTTIAVAYS